MRSCGRLPLASLAVLMVVPALAAAGGLYVPGLGPNASSMGGAFVGLADDYSAVYWNPAGIVQIQGTKVALSIQDVIVLASRDGSIDYSGGDFERTAVQTVSATAVTRSDLAPGIFLYADGGPFRSFVDKVGICAYTLVDYGIKWDANDVADEDRIQRDGFDAVTFGGAAPGFESTIGGYVIAPVVASTFSDMVSVGVAGQALYTHFKLTDGGWYATTTVVPNPPEPDQHILNLDPYERDDDLTGWAYGATVGVLVRATDRLTCGATVRTPLRAKLEGTVQVASTSESYSSPLQKESFDLTLPMWGGVGIAYRDFLFEGTTITADAHWTQWSKLKTIERTVSTELPHGLGTTELNWKDTIDFALGLERRLSRTTFLRMGYRNSPSPVPDASFNFVMPASSKNVIAVGVGYHSDVWTLDATLEYGFGSLRQLARTQTMDGKHLDDAMIPQISLTYAF